MTGRTCTPLAPWVGAQAKSQDEIDRQVLETLDDHGLALVDLNRTPEPLRDQIRKEVERQRGRRA